MPPINKVYKDIVNATKGEISHPLRGVILRVVEGKGDLFDFNWIFGSRAVDIQVTPSGASYPKTYTCVPWNSVSILDWTSKPNPGDYVDVIFKGGHSEFPTIVGVHPGPKSNIAAQFAHSSLAQVPSKALSLAKTAGKSIKSYTDTIISDVKKIF